MSSVSFTGKLQLPMLTNWEEFWFVSRTKSSFVTAWNIKSEELNFQMKFLDRDVKSMSLFYNYHRRIGKMSYISIEKIVASSNMPTYYI